MKKFEDHQLEVLEEKNELCQKINKLNSYMNSEEFRSLSGHEQSLLTQQYLSMKQYELILETRIGNF